MASYVSSSISFPRAAIVGALLGLLFGGCTSMGPHHISTLRRIDFGPPETVALCLYLDDGISEERARALIAEVWHDEAPLYRLNLAVAQVRQWSRPAFTMHGIMAALRREPLGPPCDRILALISRHLGDYVWGLLLLPEVLGAVDDETMTHGYVIVDWASLNQLVSPPRSTLRHELYHLMGCDTHWSMSSCYERIAELKHWKRATGGEFFPAWDAITERVLASREAVNARLSSAATEVTSSSGGPVGAGAPPDRDSR